MLAGYSRGVTGLCSPLRDGEYCWCKTCPGVPTSLLFVTLLQLFEASLPNFSKVGCQSVLPWVVSLPVGDIWQYVGQGLAQGQAAQQTWPWQCHQAKHIRAKPQSYTALVNPGSIFQIFTTEPPQALF